MKRGSYLPHLPQVLLISSALFELLTFADRSTRNNDFHTEDIQNQIWMRGRAEILMRCTLSGEPLHNFSTFGTVDSVTQYNATMQFVHY